MSVIVVGLVAAILVILVRNAGQDASDRAEGVSQAVAGDPAIYNANCPTHRGLRIGTIARVEERDATNNDHILVPWTAAGGYGVPTAGFQATVQTATGALGALAVDGNTNVAFFAAASRITEARHNADFDGDGEIESSEVVGVIQTDTVDMHPIVDTLSPTTSQSAAAENRGPFMVADPTAAIPNNLFGVGRQLIVNNTDSCWRIV